MSASSSFGRVSSGGSVGAMLCFLLFMLVRRLSDSSRRRQHSRRSQRRPQHPLQKACDLKLCALLFKMGGFVPLVRLAENTLPSVRPCLVRRLLGSARDTPATLASCRRPGATVVGCRSRLLLHHLVGAPAAQELAQAQRTLARLFGGGHRCCRRHCCRLRRLLRFGVAVATRAAAARTQSGLWFRFDGCGWFCGRFGFVLFRLLSTATATAAQFHARQTKQTEAWQTAPGASASFACCCLFASALRGVCVAVLRPVEATHNEITNNLPMHVVGELVQCSVCLCVCVRLGGDPDPSTVF